jgi:hypothetical protein
MVILCAVEVSRAHNVVDGDSIMCVFFVLLQQK